MFKPLIICLIIALFSSAVGLSNTPPVSKSTLSGVVIDAESNETLTGALVKIPGTNNFTYTDEQGKFSLEIPSALVVETIEISLVSFKVAKIKPCNTTDLQVKLQEK